MDKKPNVLLINPPLGIFDFIYASIPTLLGQLNNNGINATGLDFNVEFLREITSSDYLKKTKKHLKEIYNDLSILNKNVKERYKLNEEDLDFIKQRIQKYLCPNKRNLIDFYIDCEKSFFDEYLNALNLKKLDSEEAYKKYYRIFHLLVSFSFLPFYPETVYTRLSGRNPVFTVKNHLYKYNFEDIEEKCTNKLRNIYINFFEKKVEELKLNKYDIIGISIPFEQNIFPALTLSKILKEKTKANIVIGGIIPTTTIDSFISHPDMFGKYFDSILSGDGETSIVQYVNALQNKLPISEVSGLVYKKNHQIIKNENCTIKNINLVKPQNFNGINFKDYAYKKYSSLELSKGCYWHKCVYCYNNLWKKHYIMSPEKAVDIIEEINKKYNITFFHILDDAININFAEKFAKELIERNLKIEYSCLLRTENNLNFELLKILKKSGLSKIFFGIESGSERILKLMNKGIDLNVGKRILRDCKELGIKTDVGFMYGFPTETEEDILKTLKFIEENKQYIDIVNNFIFHITKSSAMLTKENIKKFQLSNISQPEEFSEDIKYDAPGMKREDICKLLKSNGQSYSLHTKWL